MRVFQTLELTICGSIPTSIFIPRTSVFVCVFQALDVTSVGSIFTSIFVPRTSVFARVFQTLEVTICGSFTTRLFIPWTSNVFVQKCKELYVSIQSHSRTKAFLLFRTLLYRPREGRFRVEIFNPECISQTHARPLYRPSTFPVDVVKELHVVPVQLRHDVTLEYLRMIRHDIPRFISRRRHIDTTQKQSRQFPQLFSKRSRARV